MAIETCEKCTFTIADYRVKKKMVTYILRPPTEPTKKGASWTQLHLDLINKFISTYSYSVLDREDENLQDTSSSHFDII